MPRKTLTLLRLNFQPRPTCPYSPGSRGGGMTFTAGQAAWTGD